MSRVSEKGDPIEAEIGGDAVQPGTVSFRSGESRTFLPCSQ
jgi:hypothetical protein